LIELLVVIAIISLLAAILFPVFGRARENARRASCQSNVKQIMLGVTQYTQDFDEKFPIRNLGLTTKNQWPLLILPYIKSTQVFQCPSDTDTTNLNSSTFHLSYIANSSAKFPPHDEWGLFGNLGDAISIAEVVSPSKTIAITDGAYLFQTTAPYVDRDTSTWVKSASQTYMLVRPNSGAATSGSYGGPTDRHLDTVVVGYADGHVKAQRLEAFYYPDTPCLSIYKGCS
jgi:prepilin-type processing-associated H-X9-DG protein